MWSFGSSCTNLCQPVFPYCSFTITLRKLFALHQWQFGRRCLCSALPRYPSLRGCNLMLLSLFLLCQKGIAVLPCSGRKPFWWRGERANRAFFFVVLSKRTWIQTAWRPTISEGGLELSWSKKPCWVLILHLSHFSLFFDRLINPCHVTAIAFCYSHYIPLESLKPLSVLFLCFWFSSLGIDF